MRLRTTVLAGAATVLVAGAAMAATGKLNTITINLADGSVAQIEYAGDVAPRVSVMPVAQAHAAYDPFAEMDRMMAQVEQQHQAMMRQAAAMQQRAVSSANARQPGQIVVSSNLPAGSSYQYTVVSSSTGNGGSCTQTVEYRSGGSSKEPQVTRASSGDCDAVKPSTSALPASAPVKPAEKPFDPRTI